MTESRALDDISQDDGPSSLLGANFLLSTRSRKAIPKQAMPIQRRRLSSPRAPTPHTTNPMMSSASCAIVRGDMRR